MNKTFIKANEFNINKLAAARMKVRYLMECVDIYIEDNSALALRWARECLEECIDILSEASYTVVQPRAHANRITPEQIEQAKQQPIEQFIDFVGGRAEAWCHTDKNPSLVWNKKFNKAWCPVCNKQFNAIEIYMHKYDVGFYHAVRMLL